MFAGKTSLLISALVTLGLLLAAYLALEHERSLRGDPYAALGDSTAPGSDLAQAGLQALRMGDVRAAHRLFLRAVEAAPGDARWQALLSRSELELKVLERSADAPPLPNVGARTPPPASEPSPAVVDVQRGESAADAVER